MHRLLGTCVLLGLAMAAPAALSQSNTSGKEPRAMVSLYHVAPGKHMAFLKWMASRDAVDQQQGLPRAQWYAHLDGDSWDYVAISPVLTDAQQKKEDDATRAKGLAIGPKASIEFREFIASHTDTMTAGPMTVSEMLDHVNGP